MKSAMVVLMMVAALGLVTSAFASNNVLEYAGPTAGKVIFDGKLHNQKLGPGKCMECHKGNVPFAMKKPGAEGSAKITAPHEAGKFCGSCHDGKKGFAQEEPNCAKCHKK